MALTQHVYHHIEKKEIYQVDKKKFGNYYKGFYIILKHKTKKGQYLDKRFDKIDINFTELESLYGKCKMLFFSKSQLYKYLKDGYIGSIQFLLPVAF